MMSHLRRPVLMRILPRLLGAAAALAVGLANSSGAASAIQPQGVAPGQPAPIAKVWFSPDISIQLEGVAGGVVHDEQIASDSLDGSPNALWPAPPLPAGTAVTAYHRTPEGVHYFAVESATTLPGGLNVQPLDLLTWSQERGFEILAPRQAVVEELIGDPGAKFDALTGFGPQSDILFSLNVSLSPGGLDIADEDLISENLGMFFDGSAAGIDPALDLDAAHYDNASQRLFVSFDGSGDVAGIAFDDEDLLEWDVPTRTWIRNPNTATGVAYDGSARNPDWRGADLDAVWLEMANAQPPLLPPSLSSISPSSVQAGSADLVLTVNGADFCSASEIVWDAGTLTTTFVSVNQLTTTVQAVLLSSPGSASITVVNPPDVEGCGAGTSGAAVFTIEPVAPLPPPVISSISPTSVQAGSAEFNLTVSGQNFCSSSSVLWNGAMLSATPSIVQAHGSPATVAGMIATVPANLIASPGSAQITVVNPPDVEGCGAGTSAGIAFTITPASSTGPQVLDVTDAATFLSEGRVAPGQHVNIWGRDLSPFVFGDVFNGSLGAFPTTWGGRRFLFDGIPAPITYMETGFVNIIVPFAVEGRSSVTFTVEASTGEVSNAVQLSVASTLPRLKQAAGRALVFRAGTANLITQANPAARGETVVFWMHGGGQTNPANTDGVPTSAAQTTRPVRVLVGGVQAATGYAGNAPGNVGLFQMDVTIPPTAPVGDNVDVQVCIGDECTTASGLQGKPFSNIIAIR